MIRLKSLPAFACVLAAVGSGVFARAEAAPILTLEQALAIAAENNRRLRVAAADVGVAAADLDEARAHRLPRAEVSETLSRTTNPTLVFSHRLGQEVFGPDDFAVDRLNQPGPLTNVNSRFSVTQPVWTGGRIKGGIAAASLTLDASDSTRERTRQEVAYEVIGAYATAVRAVGQLAVANEAVATTRAHVKLVSDLREGGLVVQSDLLLAQVRSSEVEELQIRAEAAVAIAEATVNRALGRDLGTPFAVSEAPVSSENEWATLDRLIAQAREARPDLQAAQLSADAAARVVRTRQAERRPQVDVTGQVEANSRHALDADGTNWSVFAGARLSLFDRATGARIRRAEQQRLRAEGMRDLLADSVDLDVRRAYHDLRSARKRYEQTEKAVALAREGLRMVEDRYKEGLITVVELLDAETALTRARTRETAARQDILVAGATLDLAVGRL